MNKAHDSGFGKFVPGFDFLQGLAKNQTGQIPGMPSWVAPTLDPQELDKRIGELKSVQFWLEQNATALKATIQALEVQKMTLATLKGMNMDLSAMGQAFKFPTAAASAKPEPAAQEGKSAGKSSKADTPVDPMQLWGSLTQQFQQIATGAMQEVARHAASAAAPAQASKSGTTESVLKKAATPAAKKAGARKR